MRLFFKHLVIFISLPLSVFLIAVVLFIYRDVYADFKTYNNYTWKYNFQQLGDISTKKLLKNASEKYNSYIFGSSRSTSIYACYLQEKIPGSKFFHYGNWNETIGGMYAKLKLLDSLNYSLDNVFIYFDTDYTFKNNGECNYADHYLLTHISKFKYYKNHFNSFYKHLNKDKVKILLGLEANGEIFPNKLSDPLTNDYNHTCSAEIIEKYGEIYNSDAFTSSIDTMIASGFLYVRPDTLIHKKKQISEDEQEILEKMLELFRKHNTSYTIVITPIYDQLKFNAVDSTLLFNLFERNIHDFSGINAFTQNPYNYPDRKHFQPYITKLIIDSVLKK